MITVLRSYMPFAAAVAACGLLAAGCGSAASGAGLPASRYVVCQSIAGTCGGLRKHEPSVMYLSGDGSLWAKDIAWSGWGTARATGHGLAQVNDCKPNCAEGTFTSHPITITLTRPKPVVGSSPTPAPLDGHGADLGIRALRRIP